MVRGGAYGVATEREAPARAEAVVRASAVVANVGCLPVALALGGPCEPRARLAQHQNDMTALQRRLDASVLSPHG